MKRKIYIQIIVLWLLLLFSGFVANAQNTAKIGDITTLSVSEVSGDTYVWELYDVYADVNFATTTGDCPASKAQFVNGNIGASVQVRWLENGEYFYKVTVQNSCADNVKIGRIIVTSADVPPTPSVEVSYDCAKGIATLTASNYTGELQWSTGENTEQIQVAAAGTYKVVQVVNKRSSEAAEVTVLEMLAGEPEDVAVTPNEIDKGESADLSGTGCDNGTLRWFADEALTEELDATTIFPEQTTTYYVICESEAGCSSKAVPVEIFVNQFDDATCQKLYQNMEISQLVTPNSDGTNDIWGLSNLLHYCKKCNKKAVVRLYNRWGAKVYEASNSKIPEEPFTGHSMNSLDYKNGKVLPKGTYFYIIHIDGKKEKTGYIYLTYDK